MPKHSTDQETAVDLPQSLDKAQAVDLKQSSTAQSDDTRSKVSEYDVADLVPNTDFEGHFVLFREQSKEISPTKVLPEGTKGSFELTERVGVKFKSDLKVELEIGAEKFKTDLIEMLKEMGFSEKIAAESVGVVRGVTRSSATGKKISGIELEFTVPSLKDEAGGAQEFSGFVTQDGSVSQFQGKNGVNMLVIDYGSPLLRSSDHTVVGNNVDIFLQLKSGNVVLTCGVETPEGASYSKVGLNGSSVNEGAMFVGQKERPLIGAPAVQKMKETLEQLKEPQLAVYLERLGVRFQAEKDFE